MKRRNSAAKTKYIDRLNAEAFLWILTKPYALSMRQFQEEGLTVCDAMKRNTAKSQRERKDDPGRVSPLRNAMIQQQDGTHVLHDGNIFSCSWQHIPRLKHP